MTPKQIQQAYARAQTVIDGFKCPSEQNARDVVNLLKHYSATNQRQSNEPSAAKPTPSTEIPDFLKGFFN